MNDKTRDQHARRRLKRLGYGLWKVRPASQWIDYGPFAIIDAEGNFIVSRSLTIEQVEAWLDEQERAAS